jgi:hypothetical protein
VNELTKEQEITRLELRLEPDAGQVQKLTQAGKAVEAIRPVIGGVQADLKARYGPLAVKVVRTAEEHADAEDDLVELARLKKAIEEARVKLKAPVLKTQREIDGMFKSLAEPVVAADANLRKQVLAFRTAEEKAQLEAEREAMEAGGVVVVLPALETSSGAGDRGRWVARVTDKKKLVAACLKGQGAAHLGLLLVDESALNALAKASKEHLAIPGVVVERERTLAVRSA